MPARKPFLGPEPSHPALDALLEAVTPATEEQLAEQRISFAYGNALELSERITKDSVREASSNIRVTRD